MSRQLRIRLISGKVIKIPICQKAETSKLLKEFNYPQEEIQKNDDDFIDEYAWMRRKKWSTNILLYITFDFEEKDFNYMQILLLECNDFNGNTWTNPAASYVV